MYAIRNRRYSQVTRGKRFGCRRSGLSRIASDTGGACERNERPRRTFIPSGTPGKRKPQAQARRACFPIVNCLCRIDGADEAKTLCPKKQPKGKGPRAGARASGTDSGRSTRLYTQGRERTRARRVGPDGLVAEPEIQG